MINEVEQDFNDLFIELDNFVCFVFSAKKMVKILVFDYHGVLKKCDEIASEHRAIHKIIRCDKLKFRGLDSKGNEVCDLFFGLRED